MESEVTLWLAVTLAETEPPEESPKTVISYVPDGMPDIESEPELPDTLPFTMSDMGPKEPLTSSVLTGWAFILKLLPEGI